MTFRTSLRRGRTTGGDDDGGDDDKDKECTLDAAAAMTTRNKPTIVHPR
jgi:hypothetical protein